MVGTILFQDLQVFHILVYTFLLSLQVVQVQEVEFVGIWKLDNIVHTILFQELQVFHTLLNTSFVVGVDDLSRDFSKLENIAHTNYVPDWLVDHSLVYTFLVLALPYELSNIVNWPITYIYT